jgi:hypothetical protein
MYIIRIRKLGIDIFPLKKDFGQLTMKKCQPNNKLQNKKFTINLEGCEHIILNFEVAYILYAKITE